MSSDTNRRILLIDDTPSIHEDFRKILGAEENGSDAALADARAAFLGEADAEQSNAEAFEVDSAYQGQEGLEKVIAARSEDRPYAMAFVDIRMPPGWDGVQTIKQLWKSEPDLQVVICTAFSDYSWDQTMEELGATDQLLILKKPFDSVEIWQLAHALIEKWNARRREEALVESLKTAEAEARSYASSLETMNRALQTAQASSEKSSELKGEFLVHLSDKVGSTLGEILEQIQVGGAWEGERPAGLERTIDASRELMVTLDRILDLIQLENGTLDLAKAPTPIVELTRELVALRETQAQAKGIALALELPQPIPESVECDAARVRQALDPLIDNAVRYATGAVEVRISTEPTVDWQRLHLVLEVEDDGPGIPTDITGRLFEPFSCRGSQGVGLGLAVAHELIKRMGGELTHAPGSSAGTVFTARFEVGNLSGVRMIGG